jgi:anti-sigma-K factor RskA
MVDQHVIDLLPAYALGSLDEDESVLVGIHLKECELCRRELFAYQEVVGVLAYTLPQQEPANQVKENLMQQVSAVAVAPRRPTKSLSWWQQFWSKPLSLSPILGIVAVVVVIFLVVSNAVLWDQLGSLRSSQPQPMQVVALTGTDADPDSSGMLIISSDREHGTLVVENLLDLGKNYQYQLWLIEDGQRTSGAVFSVDRDGYGSVWVSSPKPLGDYGSFGITIEPAGGSPGPTGDKVMGGEL